MRLYKHFRGFIFLFIFAGFALSATSQVLPPRIFYSDLVSGPNTGGENNNGVYVTIYGHGFGSSQGSSTVTIGGHAPAQYKLWCGSCWGGVSGTEYDKVTIQLGSSAASGNIVLTTSAGTSNGIPFTVRSGNIYFVSNSGSDSAAGTFTAPWATIPHATNTISPGDTIYVENGVTVTTPDPYSIGGYAPCVQINQNISGSNGNPKALLAYPGAVVTVGQDSANPNCGGALEIMNISGSGSTPVSDWVVGGIKWIGGSNEAMGVEGWGPGGAVRIRLIGNEATATYSNNEQGGASNFNATGTTWYGNNIHNVSTNVQAGTVTALQQGFYLGDESFSFDFEWNTIAYVAACRGFQQNSSVAGDTSYSVIIANNVIHDTACDGIVYVNMDASKGTGVQIYNNVLYNVGIGPAPPDGGAFAGVYLQTWAVTATGTATFVNNTIYNCGTVGAAGESPCFLYYPESGFGLINFSNNILDSPNNSSPYFSVLNAGGSDCSSTCTSVTGRDNLVYGQGAPPTYAGLTGTIQANPLFVSTTTPNFHLQSGSPAATAGTPTSQTTDLDGVALPQGTGYPIGAFALATGSVGVTGVSVSINPTTGSLDGSQTQQFSATVTGNANTSVTWSTSPQMGTLSSSGLYTAPAVVPSQQTLLVTATSVADNTKSATASISLIPVAVSLSSSVSMGPSGTNQFTATVSGTTQTGVTWTMNPEVGTMNSSGMYQAPASISTQQTITVTATSIADPTKSASATVTLLATQGISVGLSPSTVSLLVGQTQQFTATVTGTTQTGVTWSMSRQVGKLSTSGLYSMPLSLLALETLTVTATSTADPTKSASATITLLPSQAVSIGVSPTATSLTAGQTQQFTATVSGSTNTGVTWSLGSAVGSISSSGLYTAPSTIASQQTITATATSVADNTKSASATITLTPVSVTVSPSSVSLTARQTQQFTASVAGSTNTGVTWSLSSAVGSISSTGLYTAPSTISSQQTITAKATSNANSTKFATATITLSPTGTVSVSVSPSSVTLSANQTQQFMATVAGSSNTGVTWSLSVASGSISASGLYTAPGTISAQQTITVRATSVADATKSATATVTLSPVGVTVTPVTVSLGAAQSQQFRATVAGSSNTAVTWSLSTSTGKISTSGLYTAPLSIAASTTVTVKATSAADPTKSATAVVTLVTSGTIKVNPASASLSGAQSQGFSVSGIGTTTVPSWTISPSMGTISAAGMYTAPAVVSQAQTVTVTATLGTQTGTATVALVPAATSSSSGFSAVLSSTSTSLTIAWTAPPQLNPGDWVALSSVNAPDWWTVWTQNTNGATSGVITVPAPTAPAIYEFRYYASGTSTVLGRSAGYPIATAGFGVTSQASQVAVGSPLAFNWTAGTKKTAHDYVGLYAVGATSDEPVIYDDTSGRATGTYTFPAPSTPGTYELRYIMGTASVNSYTYLCAAKSPPITVQ